MADPALQAPDRSLGGPFPGAILLMEGDAGTKVWVNEDRTYARIIYSDGLETFGEMFRVITH